MKRIMRDCFYTETPANRKLLSCLWRLYRNSDATVPLDRESGSLV
jgi:hypothetical protein